MEKFELGTTVNTEEKHTSPASPGPLVEIKEEEEKHDADKSHAPIDFDFESVKTKFEVPERKRPRKRKPAQKEAVDIEEEIPEIPDLPAVPPANGNVLFKLGIGFSVAGIICLILDNIITYPL